MIEFIYTKIYLITKLGIIIVIKMQIDIISFYLDEVVPACSVTPRYEFAV